MFTENRAFNAAGKTVTKIGIYALPPPKSGPKCHFLAILSIFSTFTNFIDILIIRDPIDLQYHLFFFHHRQYKFSTHTILEKYIL
jgi:hypothetical protein